MKNDSRVVYLDLLKIIASFAVIVLHTSAMYWARVDVNSFDWQVFNIYDSIVRWCVPIFVMVSGALFLSRDISIKKIYSKYILRIIIAFIVWSLVYALIDLYHGCSFETFVIQFIKGHYHLWFLYMIVGLYMIIPFLKKIIQDEKLIRYFLILSFIITMIIPICIDLLNPIFPTVCDVIKYILEKTSLEFVVGYSFYFVIGYCLYNKVINKKTEIIIYILGLFGIIITILGTMIITHIYQEPLAIFYKNLTFNVALTSIAIFVFFKQHSNIANKYPGLIYKLSKYSFGVYLVHLIILETLDKYDINVLLFNSFLSVPFISIIVIIISYIVSAVLNNIPVLKKYIV